MKNMFDYLPEMNLLYPSDTLCTLVIPLASLCGKNQKN
jgi:hypothetical protein